MIVGLCGFGYSGSGAFLDLLKAFDNIDVLDDLEFSFIYKPDGIEDLERALVLEPSRYFSSDSAIRRFIRQMDYKRKVFDKITNGEYSILLDKYLKSITQVTWVGRCSQHEYQDTKWNNFWKIQVGKKLRLKWEKIFGPLKFHTVPETTMYFSYMGQEFYDTTKTFIASLLKTMGWKNNIVILDQPFSANNPSKSFKFFPGKVKSLIILRDPRDLYITAKRCLGWEGRFIPTDNVKDFVTYYKGLYSMSVKNEDVLALHFEDLIYDFDKTMEKMIDFIGLDASNFHKDRSHFNPNISINNTQLVLKHQEYRDDIQYIESQMSEYLYDFSKYQKKPKFDTKSF